MFGTREPKPVVLSDEGISKFRVISKDVSASHLRRYLSAVVGSRNRFTSQDKMMQVENYIHENFATHGWTVERQKYRFKTFDGLKSDGHGHVHMKYHDLEGVNIIATKPGKNINQIVVIGAHYDTIDNTPGADDNGSGIAALLELARVLGKYSYSKTLVLVAFDMEEIGFAGSKAFVKKLSPNAAVEGVIIFETMGYVDEKENAQRIPHGFSKLYRQQVGKVERRRFKGDFLTVIHNGESKRLASLFAGVNQSLNEAVPLIHIRDPLDLPILGSVLRRLFPALRNLLRSDHARFWEAKMPAIQLTDTANFRNPHYHKPTDTIDTINFPFLQRIVQVTALTAALLAEVQMGTK